MSARRVTSSDRALPAPLRWARKFLSHYFSDTPAAFHAELFRDLTENRRRMIARVAPRGHAKSTCASLAYPLWCICEQQKRNILIITHEASLATQFLLDIRSELETNEGILAEYGELWEDTEARGHEGTEGGEGTEAKGKCRMAKGECRKKGTRAKRPSRAKPRRGRWGQTKFTTATGITVQAKGSGAGLRGTRVGPHRPDLVICDDIEKDEHVASPEGRRKLERWLRRVVMPAMSPKGQLVLLGSLIHYDSLLANLRDAKRFSGWDYRVYRAYEFELGEDGEHRPVPLWPGRWPMEKLYEERERVGTNAFEQEYMANPIDDTLRTFREEWLQRYDENELVEPNLFTLMAVDPATGVSGGDYFAVWIGSVDSTTGVIYTRELTIERIGIVQQVDRIIDAFNRWKPAKIGIETTAYQRALKDVVEDIGRRRNLYLPLVSLTPISNKRARIEATAPLYENGTFRLPAKLDPEIEKQFLQFPVSDHDDGPDACAMGIELARAFRSVGGAADGLTRMANPYSRRGGW